MIIPPLHDWRRTLPLMMTAAGALLWNLPARAETPVVAAARVERGEVAREVSFEAEMRPFQEVELHAKVTGYLQKLTVDAGDEVKEGQVIATLEVPELMMEIEHAEATQRRSKAEIDRAEASFEEVHQVYNRLLATDKAQPHLIAQQDIDAAKARDRSAQAAIDSAKEQANVADADVKKLKATLEYSRITVPFTGVITKRYADPGALIQAGTSTGAMPVVRLSENDKLRLVFPVSLSYVSQVKVGDPVEIRVPSLNRVLKGTVARFSRKVETATRTMDTEVDVPNKDLSLIPGIYATAVLKADSKGGVLLAPVEGVLRDKNESSVYVINKDHKIEARKVVLGRETPTRLEIREGVTENEMILVGDRTRVQPGQLVEPKLVEPAVTAEESKAPKTAKAP